MTGIPNHKQPGVTGKGVADAVDVGDASSPGQWGPKCRREKLAAACDSSMRKRQSTPGDLARPGN